MQLRRGKWDPRAIRAWNGNLINRNHLDNALGLIQLTPCFHIRLCIQGKRREGRSEGVSLISCGVVQSEFGNLCLWVHRRQGKEGIIIQPGLGLSVSHELGRTRWPRRGWKGKPWCSFSQPRPAWDSLPNSTLFPLPSLHVDIFPSSLLSCTSAAFSSWEYPRIFKINFFLGNCVQLYHYLESAPQHFREYAGIFYGLCDLWLGFSLCLGCGRWELNSSVSDHLFLVYRAIKNKNSPVKYCK